MISIFRSCIFSTVAILAAGGISCASQNSNIISWDDAADNSRLLEHDESPSNNGPFAQSKELSPIIQEKPPEPPVEKTEDAFGGGQPSASITPAGMQIDRALNRFRARRAAAGEIAPESHVHGLAWLELLSAIDDACTIRPTADDLGAFVRARMTLEVEAWRDNEKKRSMPNELASRLDEATGAIDARVAELRLIAPPGSLFPARSDRDGALVLAPPLTPMRITSGFGIRTDPIHGKKRFHAGIDLGGSLGTNVTSSSDGLVIFSGRQGGYGNHVVIDHGDGVRTHYSHLSRIFVKSGELVKAAVPIGAVGATGRATGPHLHFAITNRDGHFLDPLPLMNRPLSSSDFETTPQTRGLTSHHHGTHSGRSKSRH
jgi:murein DD-endopeptidase MepM/ murein hydrolase activator NlpD